MSNKYREYYKYAKNPILLELLDAYDRLLIENEELKKDKSSKKEPTLNNLIQYCDKEFKKKFGNDEIFTSFPVPATTIMKLSFFMQRTSMNYDTYKAFAYWLINKPSLRKKLGRTINVYDLYNEKLYKMFQEDGDNFNVEDRKKLNSKRIFKV